MPYTEGIYDDVNRVLWLQWEWDPRLEAGLETRAPATEADGAAPADRAVRPHLERYARWWFGDAAAADVADVYLTVEQSWKGPIRGNETVPACASAWRRSRRASRSGSGAPTGAGCC